MQNLTYRDLVLTGIVVEVENTDVIGLFSPSFLCLFEAAV